MEKSPRFYNAIVRDATAARRLAAHRGRQATCSCGCGETFFAVGPARYLNDAHRQRAYRLRKTPASITLSR